MSSNTSGISWGPWSRLPNGQWHREGQDSAGNWYEDNQDEKPKDRDRRVPRQSHTPSVADVQQGMEDLDVNQSSDVNYSSSFQGQGYSSYDQGASGQPFQGAVATESYSRPSDTGSRHKGKGRHTENSEQFEPSRRTHDKRGGSRSSKGDIKGQGHPSSRKTKDGKSKSSHNEQQPAIASSSRHRGGDLPTADEDFDIAPPSDQHGRMGVEGMAQNLPPPTFPAGYAESPAMTHAENLDQYDENAELDLPQDLQQGVSDVYMRGPSIAGPSSGAMFTPGIAPGYYGPVEDEEEEEDELSELPELPRRGSYSRSTRAQVQVVSEDIPYNEDWSQYVQEHSRKFTFGTVFKIMWSEPMGNTRLSKHNKDPVGTGTSISEFGKRDINGTILYEGIRRFIVIDGNENGARNGNSICVPIATYKKQGCTKHGVKPSQHGMIYTHDRQMPRLLPGEPQLGVNPIRLMVNRNLEGFERLAIESRINYSKHVTIEHNSSVHLIGRIHPDDLDILEAGVDSNWEKRVRDRKKDKKQERHRGK